MPMPNTHRVSAVSAVVTALCLSAAAVHASPLEHAAGGGAGGRAHPVPGSLLTQMPPDSDGADECRDMTPERMRAIVTRIDPQARTSGNVWEFSVEGESIALVFDTGADRMRLMMPVVDASEVDAPMMQRLLEANFDTTLDARYAIARDTLWATFIHPLSPLSDEEFASAIAQTVSIARSYGSTFSSGVWAYSSGEARRGR